jgi:hypothetical protein
MSTNRIEQAIESLRAVGNNVERTFDLRELWLPCMYRVNGGPELTEMQLIGFAYRYGLAP